MAERLSSHEQRSRHACEPCRRKKTKCPGERPVCSFCRRLNQRCTYVRRDVVHRPVESRHDSKDRLRQLESQVERMNGVLQTLTEQRAPEVIIPDQWIAQHGPEAVSQFSHPPVPCFDASTCPHPPPETLMHLVETYETRLHLQPLPLFDISSLSTKVASFPSFLLRSFLAITLLFSDPPFYINVKREAIEFYVRSARPTVIHLAAEGRPTLEVLRSLCLLTLVDIAASRQPRTWMNIGIASRLTMSLQSCDLVTLMGPPASAEDKARCCWSVFILEKAFSSAPGMLQLNSPPLASFDHLPSPSRPPHSVEPNLSISASPTSEGKDLGINSYYLQLLSIWSEVAAYLRQVRQGQVEDPWLASSKYQRLGAKFYEFESGFAQLHRLKNVGFHNMSPSEIARDRHYWRAWIQLQTTFHTGQALLNHPLFHIKSFRKPNSQFQPPSFLQQTVDQALLHSGWTARLISTCESLGLELNNPFLGHLVAVTATVHWIFQFANEALVAERAQLDFEQCRRFLLQLAGRWPHFTSTVNRLEYLQTLTQEVYATTGSSGTPSFKLSLIWDLLDLNSPSTAVDGASLTLAPRQRITTQHLAPLCEPSIQHRASFNGPLDSVEDQTLFSDYLINTDDFFSEVDIPIFSNLQSQANFNLHGEL